MPVNAGRTLIRDFARQSGEELVVTGGEPLTHPDCVDFIQEAKDCGVGTTLFSMGVIDNVRVVDHTLLDRLARILDVWRVSLHASDDSSHDDLTKVPGSFKATCKAVERIVTRGIEVRATFFAHNRNISDLPDVAALCSRLGIVELRVLTVVPQGRAAAHPERFMVLREEVIQATNAANAINEVHVRLGEAARARQGDESACRAIREELVVSYDGWVSPCHSFEPPPSDSDDDNVFRANLQRVLEKSPRLLCCRKLGGSRSDGCSGGCVARLAILGID